MPATMQPSKPRLLISHPLLWMAIILGVSVVLSAWMLASQIKHLRPAGVITVKGLAEAPYQADKAQMQVGIAVWDSDYAAALSDGERQFNELQQFLVEQGFALSDQHTTSIDVTTHVEDYQDDRGYYRTRNNGYDAKQTLTISSTDLDKVSQTLAALQDYRSHHSDITFEQPMYLLSDLENIKHELISKATEDAGRRAAEFAKMGNVQVGSMRSASQGSFNILDANDPDRDDGGYGGSYNKDSINKIVRLVVTIDYTIQP